MWRLEVVAGGNREFGPRDRSAPTWGSCYWWARGPGRRNRRWTAAAVRAGGLDAVASLRFLDTRDGSRKRRRGDSRASSDIPPRAPSYLLLPPPPAPATTGPPVATQGQLDRVLDKLERLERLQKQLEAKIDRVLANQEGKAILKPRPGAERGE